MIVAIDPGPTQSAYVYLTHNPPQPPEGHITPNQYLLGTLTNAANADNPNVYYAVEWFQSYGMPVGASVFDTVAWIGRFAQAIAPEPLHRVTRVDVRNHICHNPRANDANIRAALIDRYGGDRKTAIGTKQKPGPLYGFKTHLWAALALAITFAEKNTVSGSNLR